MGHGARIKEARARVHAAQQDHDAACRDLGAAAVIHDFLGQTMVRDHVEEGVRRSLSGLPMEERRSILKRMLTKTMGEIPIEKSGAASLCAEADRALTSLQELLSGQPPALQALLAHQTMLRLQNPALGNDDVLGPDLVRLVSVLEPEVREVVAARLVNNGAVVGDPELHFLKRYSPEERERALADYEAASQKTGGDGTCRLSPAVLAPLARREPAPYVRPTYAKLSERARADLDRLEHYMRTQIMVGRGDDAELYLRAGAVWYECGFRQRDDIDALTNGLQVMRGVDAGDANELLHLSRGKNMHLLMFCGRWFASGAPRVRLNAAQAAALILTDLPDNFLDADLHHPWPAFVIDLPGGLIPIGDGSDYATRLLVHRVRISNEDCLWWMMAEGEATGLSVARGRLSDLQDEDDLCGDGKARDAHIIVLGHRMRAPRETAMRFAALAKLLAGVCYKLQEKPPAAIRPPGGGAIRRRPGGPPETTEIKLGFPVKVDFSNLVRAHLLGHVKRLTKVQWLVRGHWRNQACGPQRTSRRMTWIEPFWKGPLDAPILVRPHLLAVVC